MVRVLRRRDGEGLLPPSEVAKILRVPNRRILELSDAGEIEAVRSEGFWRRPFGGLTTGRARAMLPTCRLGARLGAKAKMARILEEGGFG